MTDEKKPVMLFGRNLAEIPCFRESFLYGILGGIGSGLTFFMFSSKVGTSTHFGFGSFVITTLSYWTYCRIRFSDELKNALILEQLKIERAKQEGISAEEKKEKLILESV